MARVIAAAAGLIDEVAPPVPPQFVHRTDTPPAVTAGQTWAHRDRRRSAVTVLAVDRASVWTDQGRTTVFRLLRDRRLVEPATSHHA